MATEKLEIVISAVDKASGPVKGIQKTFQGFGKFALKGLAVGAAAGATAIAGLGAAAAKLAIDAAPLQQVQSAFDGIAESAGVGGDAMLKSLQEGSAGMITNRDLMISFNKAASLVSKDFAVQLPDAMGMLSKVAASTGQDMGFLMDSLVTGVGRMSPMILDNLGIQVSLTEATDKAAEMFGVQAEELSKAQQQAGLMNVVMEKLGESTADIPEVTGSAMQGWESLQTTLANTKDEIGLALLPVFTPLLNKLGEMASELLPKVINAIAPFLEQVGEIITILFDAGLRSDEFKEALGRLIGDDAAQGVINVIRDITGFVKGFIAGLQEGMDPITAIMDAFVNWTGVGENLSDEMRDLVFKIWDIWDAIKAGAKPVIDFIKKHVEMKDVLIAAAIGIASVVIPAIASLIGAILSIAAPIIAAIAIVVLIRKAWESNFLGIRDKTKAILNFLKEFIGNTLAAIKEFWAEHGEEIMRTAEETWEAILDFIEVFTDNIKQVVDAFALAFEGDWYNFGVAVREIWDKMWERIKELASKAIEAILNIDWAGTGKGIIQGIANGVTAAATLIKDAVLAAVKAAWEAAKGFLGLESPSKLFEQMGMNLMEGMALGIQGNATTPVVAATGAAASVSNAVEQNFNLTINEAGRTVDPLYGFEMMKALARGV